MANEFKIKKGLIVTGALGGTVVDIQGSQGQLFSVTDNLSGSIFAVSDISGVPIFDVNSSGLSTFDGNVTLASGTTLAGMNTVRLENGVNKRNLSCDGSGNLDISNAANNTTIFHLQDNALTLGTSVGSGSLTLYTGSINSNGNIKINTGSHLFFDGGTNATYISEDVADRLRFFVGGAEFMRFTESTADTVSIFKDTTFATQAFATTATSSGDASSTLTTKGYVDSLITGATIYRGTWDPDVSLNSGYGNPNLNTVTKTSGYYYICSADGTATPNGTGNEPNTWNTGDWVIWNDDIGTSGEWQKIDNTSVLSGVGTGQTVALWQGASSVTDSETLGNAPITVSGNNSTFAGNVTVGGGITVSSPGSSFYTTFKSANDYVIGLKDSANTTQWWLKAYTNGSFALHEDNAGDKFTIAAGGNATFAGSITFNGTLNSTGNLILSTASTGANIEMYTNGNMYYDAVSHNFRDSDASPTYFNITASQVNSFVSLAMNNYKITTLATPTNAADAATKAYVDAHGGGLGPFLPLSAGSSYPVTGAAYFTAQGAAAYGTINLESDDPFIRLYDNGTGSTADKKKWDIRVIGAAGFETFDIRTVNDANTVFSTKLSIAHDGDATFSKGATFVEDVLVGKTSNTIATAGAKIGATTGTNITRDSNEVLYLNRTTNFGKTLSIAKDGTTIGEIGTYSGVPYIGYSQGGGGGIMFNGLSIEPTAVGASRTSNTNDIGSTNYKWKNGWFGSTLQSNIIKLDSGLVELTSQSTTKLWLTTNQVQLYAGGLLVFGGYNSSNDAVVVGNETGDINITLAGGANDKVLYLEGSSGNVGIGTKTPLAKLDIQGTQGQLFSVTDNLSGSIFAVADISGVPIFDVNSSGVSYFDGKVEIGTATVAAANAAADDLWLRSTGSNGITISSGNAQTGTIFFGDVANAAVAGFRYNHNTGDMAISAEDNITFACDNVGIGTTSLTNSSGYTTLSISGSTGGQIAFQTSGTGKHYIYSSTTDFNIYNSQAGNLKLYTNSTERININSAGAIKFNTYTMTQQTGTSAYLLGVDASGNVVQSTNIPTVTGGPFLPLAGGTMDSGAEISFDVNNSLGQSFVKSGGSLNLIIDSNNNSNTANFIIEKNTQTAGSGTELFRVQEDGNVGIGTTSPGSKLELGPNGSLGANITNKNVILNIDGGYGTTGTPSSGQYKVIGFTATTKDVTDITGQTSGEVLKNFYLGMIGGDYFNVNRFSFWQGGDERLTIQGYGANAGNVGIGTTSPDAILETSKEVDGNQVGALLTNTRQTGTADSVSLNFGLGRTADGYIRSVDAIKLLKEQQWTGTVSTVDAALVFSTVQNETVAERMRIDSAGMVGIGIIPGNGFGLARLSLGTGAVANEIITFASASGGNAELRNTSSTGTFTFTNSDGSSEKMRINADGYVGIGTTSPGAKLEVVADVAKGVLINRTYTTSSQSLANVRAYYGLAITPLRGGTGGLYFTNYDADTPIIQSVNTSDVAQFLLLNPLGGNVGIGTTSPGEKLEVNGRIKVQTSSGSLTLKELGSSSATIAGSATVGIEAAGNFRVKTNVSNEAFTVLSTGNVGIGVTGPTTKLDVGGSVRIAAGSNLYFTSSNTTFKIQQDTTNSELDIYGGALVPAISIDNSSHLALPGYGLSGSGTPIKLLGLDSSSNVVTATSFNLRLDDTPAANTTSGSGNIVNWSVSESVTAGTLYAVKTNGGWTIADADSEAKSTYMLAIALGSNATAGMLLQGFFYKSSHGFTIGAPLYVSNTAGAFSNSRPTGSGDYVRIIGYATSTNYIYFDPDKTWVKIA